MLNGAVHHILAQVGFLNIFAWVTGTILTLTAILAALWNFTSYIKSRASKQYVDEELSKKANQKDFDEHRLMFEQFRIRHEQHNSEIQRLFYKKVDDLDQKFDKKFDDLKDNIIEILKHK